MLEQAVKELLITRYKELEQELPLSYRAQLLHLEPFSNITCFQLETLGYLTQDFAESYSLTDKGRAARDLMVWWITRDN